ncbi:M14 family zinc carboxypeptidase [Ferrimonas marina]|uniref:Zinc carboxypeptidase n=1 Tax=Ferrimonas marina TaxID=299255 RepID=A0A1M5Z9B6_9GAMM|nr:M14 family zinc carboxypeptidase [Ferrimonas marina]SHI20804.1 Zinc carboxypeptidase [Ferrimonas marina]
MIRPLLLALLGLCLGLPAAASLLPEERYTSQITTPEQHFRGPVGSRHLRYDEVQGYFETLAAQSDRVALETIGYSHQGRPQLVAVISSPDNLARQAELLESRAGVRQGQADEGPLVIWLAYSIHGDEASGLHAANLFAYYLAASNSEEVARWLEQAVILITPSQNPDGNDRFANWVNGHRGTVPSDNNWHREHFQAWPTGRVNHFWADLNRDWLYQAHPESRGRVALFQRWLPQVVSDYHEMAHQSSYFFQPGVPDRTHPLTPKDNQAITARLANHHAKALDGLHQPYFSRETFDDFFYGKGSTYPDINGSVGILFEQATARGLLRATERGPLTLSRGIRNHLATSFSTVRGAMAESEALRSYQLEFFRDSLSEGKRRKGAGYLLSSGGDRSRLAALTAILDSHHIGYGYLSESVSVDEVVFQPGDLFLPFAQPQYRLLEAMLDKRTEFADNTFYDVSAFAVDLAFGLNLATVKRAPEHQAEAPAPTRVTQPELPLHWHLAWHDRFAPAALHQLQLAGIRVRFAENDSVLRGVDGSVQVRPGDLLILADQPGLAPLLAQIEQQLGLRASAVISGQAESGYDPGGRRYHFAKPVKPLVLIGRDVSQYEAGELWYFLDQVVQLDAVLVHAEYALRVPKGEFTHLFLVDGAYNLISPGFADWIDDFVRNGGTVVGWKRGAAQLASWDLINADVRQRAQLERDFAHASDRWLFAQRFGLRAQRTIGGAIVDWQLDTSHPLGFALPGQLPMMKNREFSLLAIRQDEVARYPEQMLRSGFMAEAYQQALVGHSAAVVERRGQGQYILFADNPLFRNFWLGGEKLVANSLFMVPSLRD